MAIDTATREQLSAGYNQVEAELDETLRHARIERYGANPLLRFAMGHFQHVMYRKPRPDELARGERQPRERIFTPPAPFHARLTERCYLAATTPNGREASAYARDFAKSTYGTELLALLVAAEKLRENIVIIGASSQEKEYQTRLRNITREIETNESLLAEYPGLAPARDSKGQWISFTDAEIVLANGVRIGAMPLGGNIRGQKYEECRPDLVIFDDPETRKLVRSAKQLKRAFEWIREDALGALAPGGSIIWNGTYLSHACMLLSARAPQPEGLAWPGIEVPIETEDQQPNWPDLFPYQECRRLEREHGPRAYAIERLLKPQADEDKLFTIEQFEQHRYSRNRLKQDGGGRWLLDGQPLTVYQRVDPASGKYEDKGDRFALATIGLNPRTQDLYLLDLFTGRIPYRRQVEVCQELYDHWQPRKQRIESNQVQVWLAQGVLENRAMRVEEINSTRNKYERIEAWSILVGTGKVHLDLTQESQAELVHTEADQYPLGKYDDGLDAVSGACEDALEDAGTSGGDPSQASALRPSSDVQKLMGGW